MGDEADIRVMVVDDDGFVRSSLAWFIDQAQDLTCVATCADGEEAVAGMGAGPVDVVVMDVHMPGLDGVGATRRILADHPGVRILMWTSLGADDRVAEALAAGAAGFLLKAAAVPEVLEAIRAAHRGLVVLGVDAAKALHPAALVPPLDLPRLSPRETDVLACLRSGMSNAEIGRHLHLSPSSVKLQVANLMTKFGVGSRLRLVIRVFECGLI